MKTKINFQKIKKVCVIIFTLALELTICIPLLVSAAEVNNTKSEVAQESIQSGMSGFGQLCGKTTGDFYVPVSGSASTGGITIKALNCPSNAYIVASIYRPDGTLLTMSVPNGLGFIQLIPGNSDYLNRYQFLNATYGNYRVHFDSTTTVDILCWIYG